MFLDRQLCIRKFTPRIAETFRVIPHDVGRPLRTFTHDLHASDADGRHRAGAARRASRSRRRPGTSGGRCYFLRILPYRARAQGERDATTTRRSPAAAPDGVVLTLTDISALEQARARLAQLSAIVESSDDAIVGKTLDGIVTTLEQRREPAVRLHRRGGDRAARELPLSARTQGGSRHGPPAGPRRAGRSSGWRRSACARTARSSTSR